MKAAIVKKSITKSVLVTITGALVLAAGLRCLLLLNDVPSLQAIPIDDLAYMLQSCRFARELAGWNGLLCVTLCLALPVSWFCARRLGPTWRIYHLSALTFGGSVMAFYWVGPMIYRLV